MTPPLVTTFQVGRLKCHTLEGGRQHLDGGAMFGVVPKTLWEKRAPADDRNRITMAMRPLLVRGERLMIIDAGSGDKMDAKFADIYGFDRRESLDVTMAKAGVRARSSAGVAGTPAEQTMTIQTTPAARVTPDLRADSVIRMIGLPPEQVDSGFAPGQFPQTFRPLFVDSGVGASVVPCTR